MLPLSKDHLDKVKRDQLRIQRKLIKGYRGNQLIKRSGEKIEWTPE